MDGRGASARVCRVPVAGRADGRDCRCPRRSPRAISDAACYRCDLITRRIADAVPLSEALAAAPGRALESVGATVRRLHDAGADHADLNAHNILIDPRGMVSVIDFDRGRLRRHGGRWAARNLRRLRRSLVKISAGLPADRFGERAGGASWPDMRSIRRPADDAAIYSLLMIVLPRSRSAWCCCGLSRPRLLGEPGRALRLGSTHRGSVPCGCMRSRWGRSRRRRNWCAPCGPGIPACRSCSPPRPRPAAPAHARCSALMSMSVSCPTTRPARSGAFSTGSGRGWR